MDPKFASLVENLAPKLESLLACPPYKGGVLPKIMPERGIYLFSEEDQDLYIGRSNRLRQRYRGHCSPGATHHSAAFAMLIARRATGKEKAAYKVGPNSRAGLSIDPDFRSAFQSAKARVRAMQYRFVEETDSNSQALLEIYCAVVLATPYNDFGNH